MPSSAMQVCVGYPLTSRRKPMRCDYCERVLYLADFERGLAESRVEWSDTLGGPEERDVYAHTYDCENVSRRLTEKPDAE